MQDAFLHALPAFIPSQEAVGVKWVGGYSANRQRSLPYITGLLILNDCGTGTPISIMDCTWITAQRTGAATALSAKFLAPRTDSAVVAILGCGVQGRSNLEALARALELRIGVKALINPWICTLRRFPNERTHSTGPSASAAN